MRAFTKMALIATAGVLLCPLSGCARKEPKEITLTIKVPQLTMTAAHLDSDITSAAEVLQKAGNDFASQYSDAKVKIQIIQYAAVDEQTEIEDCFDTNDQADVLYNDYFSMETHVYSGRVVPLDDIITKEIWDDIGETFWQQSRRNGKIYMMPYLYRQNVLAYNKDLFREAGLERFFSDTDEIQSWTMQEWETILATLRESMPDTSYPLMMYAKNNQGDTHMMCYIRSQGSSFFDAQGAFDLETEEGVAGLAWIRECVEKGYAPKNAAYMELLDFFDLWTSGQLAFFVANLGNMYTFKCDYGLVNFPTVNGGCNTNFLTGFEVFDNGDADRLAAAKAFVQYMYESDYLDYSSTCIPCSNKIFAKYAEVLAPVKKFIANAEKGVNFTGGNPEWGEVRKIFYLHMQDLLSGDKSAEQVALELDADANAVIAEAQKKSTLHE